MGPTSRSAGCAGLPPIRGRYRAAAAGDSRDGNTRRHGRGGYAARDPSNGTGATPQERDGQRLPLRNHLDGYQSVVAIEDAVNGDVLLADRLNDEDLPPEHGALLRLVSPSQYGYKSTKHLCRIHLHTAAPKSKLGRREHPRARVSLEERHPTLPPWRVRWLYRLAVPIVSYTQYLGTRRRPSRKSRKS